jgi:DNA-binding transcriptional LysR family regulator
MTLKHLRIFQEVYKTENITRAAEDLYMTQPAVSRAIRELEEQYHVKLFERFHRRLTVTAAGKDLYSRSLQLLAGMDEIERSLRSSGTAGELRIGSSITIGNFLLPDLAVEFGKKYPDIRLSVTVSNGQSLEKMLLENELDAALIENAVLSPELHAEKFMEDSMVPVVCPGHALLKKKKVLLKDLSAFPLLLREKDSAARSFTDNVFLSRELEPKPLWESTSTQALIRAAEKGLGVAIVPYRLAQAEIESGNACAVALADEKLVRTCSIAYHRDKYLTEGLKSFLALCRQRSARGAQ